MSNQHDRDVLHLLQNAADLIRPIEAWTQGTAARRASGIGIYPASRYAVCFCAVGAMSRAGEPFWGEVRLAALAALTAEIPAEFSRKLAFAKTLAAFNDDATHADVLALFQRAIKTAGLKVEQARAAAR